ncbi:hypothetical protein Bca101_082084 [Brassica carinata]
MTASALDDRKMDDQEALSGETLLFVRQNSNDCSLRWESKETSGTLGSRDVLCFNVVFLFHKTSSRVMYIGFTRCTMIWVCLFVSQDKFTSDVL